MKKPQQENDGSLLLIANIMPHHHKREIGSLPSVTKKKSVQHQLMEELAGGWFQIDLPLTNEGRFSLINLDKLMTKFNGLDLISRM
jgi:hypothetical protein